MRASSGAKWSGKSRLKIPFFERTPVVKWILPLLLPVDSSVSQCSSVPGVWVYCGGAGERRKRFEGDNRVSVSTVGETRVSN